MTTRVRRPRRKKYEGETYLITKDERGENKLKCKFCLAVVPIHLWWEHKCQVDTGDVEKQSSE